eukprot:1626246-Prymnesium_polylepis.1
MHTKNKKIGGGKDVKSGFLALRFFHPPGHPDKLGVQGLCVTDTDEVVREVTRVSGLNLRKGVNPAKALSHQKWG